MNNNRRKRIRDVMIKLEEVLRSLLRDEQASFENIPESLQFSDNAINSEEAQGHLESAIDCIAEAITYLEDI